jgi:solute:Na+ symporter, SSS family
MYFIVGGTIFSAFAFLGGPGWAYSRGAAVLYILSYGVIGIAPWYFVGRRPRASADATTARHAGAARHHAVSEPLPVRAPGRDRRRRVRALRHAADERRRHRIQRVTQGHVPFWLGAAIAYGVVMLYVLIGGASAVGWTNVFEGVS